MVYTMSKHLSKISIVERNRLKKLNTFESQARLEGFKIIAGIDEAGRGPLAGPVVAAVCIIPEGVLIKGVDDSKKLTSKQREELFEEMTSRQDISYAVGIVEVEVIDKINILQATIQAMLQAVANLDLIPDLLLVDGLQLPHPTLPVRKIIKGDSLSQSIAAASIIAKETRDRLMRAFHDKWPQYQFNLHKGYGTEKHLEAIQKYGPCPIHRRSFAPFKQEEQTFFSFLLKEPIISS